MFMTLIFLKIPLSDCLAQLRTFAIKSKLSKNIRPNAQNCRSLGIMEDSSIITFALPIEYLHCQCSSPYLLCVLRIFIYSF